ncbi:MAG: hypothetical protein M1442_03960 [Candidatus Thermoplasmatota archaeon]|nr:hypothetical protein [Candidatus Thermoplasmatota archaeon]
MGSQRIKDDSPLRRLGLSGYEKKIVSAMISSGLDTFDYREAMKLGGIPYGKVYFVLNSLEKKGFLRNLGGRPKRYSLTPLGEVIDDYLITPLIRELLSGPLDSQHIFRDTWTRQVCSSIPVLRLEGYGSPSIEMLSGLEEIRKAQIAEIMNASGEILFCFSKSNFLDRKFTSYIKMSRNVKIKLITSVPPDELLATTARSDREQMMNILSNEEFTSNIRYYHCPGLKERFMVIDGRFTAVGSDVSPVLAHIHSTAIGAQMRNRFEELRGISEELQIGKAISAFSV